MNTYLILWGEKIKFEPLLETFSIWKAIVKHLPNHTVDRSYPQVKGSKHSIERSKEVLEKAERLVKRSHAIMAVSNDFLAQLPEGYPQTVQL